jgi:DNA-binding response OmpR family regulator
MDDFVVSSPIDLPRQTIVGEFLLDRETIRVWRKDKPLKLSMKQFRLMEVFIQRDGEPVSRQTLKRLVWGAESTVGQATIDAEIVRLRRAIGGRRASSPIRTVRGLGYMFSVPRPRVSKKAAPEVTP